MKFTQKDIELIENKVLNISNKFYLISVLAKIIEEANSNLDNIEKRDISALLTILGAYIKMASSKLQKLEVQLLHMKQK